jgi:UrcA family protein
MTRSTFKFGFPLTIALAVTGAAAFAQDKNSASDIKVRAGQVQETTEYSDDGIPVERYKAERAVSYANLDLSRTSDATELQERVKQAAKDVCKELDTAEPLDVSDDPNDNTTCVRDATAGAMSQVKAAIAAATSGSGHATQANLK